MKAFILYIHLIFVLQLCGSNFIFAAVNHSAESFSVKQSVEKKHKVKHKSSNHYNLIIESTDVDLDEEFYSADECNDIDSTTILSWLHGSSKSDYFSFSDKNSFSGDSPKDKLYNLRIVDSTPIYLKLAVLRI